VTEFSVVSDEYRQQVTRRRGKYTELLKTLDKGATVYLPADPVSQEGRLIRNRLGNAASMRGVRFRYGTLRAHEAPGMIVWFEERQ
jgi:hypothetical protein